jgi:hypothetical protein
VTRRIDRYPGALMRASSVIALAVVALATAPGALADDWLPHPSDATWTYQWTDSAYNTTPTKEKVTVDKKSNDATFTLDWTTDGLENPDGAPTSTGNVSFQETNSGLNPTDWSSNAPPASFPVLCATQSQCGNSLASTYFNVIWGSLRSPVLAEPLLRGTTWASAGGTQNDVSSSSQYLGVEKISVPAFSQPVLAAKVRSSITQIGALGDPYGSGTRTIWWVYGVGPVKVVFAHTGGTKAPVTTSVLTDTNQAAKPPPPDVNYFPLVKGKQLTYRWTNSRYFKAPVVEKFSIDAVSNGSAQISAANVSGPITVKAVYGFTERLDGVTNIYGSAKAATLAKLPTLGPKAQPPTNRRHFFTPFDLMDFGFNPILPAYGQPGTTWSARRSGRDFQAYGVTGTSKVIGVQTVKVPAGTFHALAVVTKLTEPGFPAGSGTRTSWFAPDRGLVKLVFRHGDGSTSEVDLLK